MRRSCSACRTARCRTGWRGDPCPAGRRWPTRTTTTPWTIGSGRTWPLRVEDHGISDGDRAGCGDGSIDAEAGLALLADRAQDRGVSCAGGGIDVDHDAALIALVDAHAQRADLDRGADPGVLGIRGAAGGIDEDIGAESLDGEVAADESAEAGLALLADRAQDQPGAPD